MLKNFAMMGVAGGDGLITVTDNDLIEKSNLNRQFLFRPKDIQKPKSTSAANAAIAMNPTIKIDAHLNKVGQESENIYTDAFFKCTFWLHDSDDMLEPKIRHACSSRRGRQRTG